MDSKNLRNLFEAYSSVYEEPQEELNEEQIWEEVKDWVNSLIEEGYDLSDYNWEEMYKAYVKETWGTDPKKFKGSGQDKAILRGISAIGRAAGFGRKAPDRRGQVYTGQGWVNKKSQLGNINPKEGTGKGSPTDRPTPPRPAASTPATRPTAAPAAASGGGAPTRPAAPRPAAGAAPRPAAPTRASSPTNASTAEKIKGGTQVYDAQRKAGDFKAASQTGSKTWALANPSLANKPKTPNPLLAGGDIRRMQQASQMRQKGIGITSDQIKSAERTKPTSKEDFEWGSTSKVVEEMASAYMNVYEAKKVDQDKDGDNDFADVRIARMIAAGVPKEEAIRRVRNKSYNEETELDEAAKRTPKKVRGAKDDESYMAGRSDAGKRISGNEKQGPASYTSRWFSKSPTTKPGERPKNTPKVSKSELNYARTRHKDVSGKDWNRFGGPKGLPEDFELWINELLDEGYDLSEYTLDEMYEIYEEYELNEATRMRKELGKRGEIKTRRKMAMKTPSGRKFLMTGRKSPFSGRRYGPIAGSDDDLQNSRLAAKTEDFELWINELLDEGYDLSEYTLDEMYEIYEETAKEKEERINNRRARIAELQASGRVLTSSKRASARAKERREEQKAERLERLANQALESTRGATRRSSKPMGSEEPEAKPEAPAANRRLKSTVKNDRLASRADELLRMLRNENFQLWVEELIEEGYDLNAWTDEELVSLYEEIVSEMNEN